MELSGRKILVTGARGMLGTDLVTHLKGARAISFITDCVAGDEKSDQLVLLDITDEAAVREAVVEFQPEWIINCAAYTNVDKAEEEKEAAFMVNASGVENLAKVARDYRCKLLHVSTDYIYGGSSEAFREQVPYKEEDPPAACGVYGRSKLSGEELLVRTLPERHLIVRTSWLHGVAGPNFVHTILRLGKEREEIRVVDDQVGSPTWTWWLAEILLQLVGRDQRGVFNASSRGNISWYEFAREIVGQAGLELRIYPQTTEELNRPAPRPAYSTLDVTKLETCLGRPCLGWKEGVRGHLKALRVLKED